MRSRTMRNRYSRRAFLASSLAVAARAAETTARGRILPSVAVRYADPATEFTVLRLTDPQFTSSLPAVGNRGVTARQLLYASDLDGKWQAYRMDLKSKESRQLTDAENLDPSSIALLANERGFWHFDGPSLVETSFPALKSRVVYQVPEGFDKLPGASYSDDGRYAAFVEKSASGYRLRLLHTQSGEAATLLESSGELSDPLLRPRDTSLMYRTRRRAMEHPFQRKGKPPTAAGRRRNAAGPMGCGRSRGGVPESPGRSQQANRLSGNGRREPARGRARTPKSPTPASSCASTPTRTPVSTWARAAARLRPIYFC